MFKVTLILIQEEITTWLIRIWLRFPQIMVHCSSNSGLNVKKLIIYTRLTNSPFSGTARTEEKKLVRSKNKSKRRLYGPSNILPSGGVKKLKKESLGTVLVTVLTVPRPLCFCFFLIVFNVTFLPFTQSIVHLRKNAQRKGLICVWQNKLERNEMWHLHFPRHSAIVCHKARVQMTFALHKYRRPISTLCLFKTTTKMQHTRGCQRQKLGICCTHPVQLMISGPSKEKGSLSSGSDLIL